MKLWGGRFTEAEDKRTEEFNESLSFDKRMYRQDITGSIAHAEMLGKQGIISEADSEAIMVGLRGILQDIEDGKRGRCRGYPQLCGGGAYGAHWRAGQAPAYRPKPERSGGTRYEDVYTGPHRWHGGAHEGPA